MKLFDRHALLVAAVVSGVSLFALASPPAQAQSAGSASALVGDWRLNQDLSDKPQDREQDGDRYGGRRRGERGGFGRRGGFGGGGFGRSGGNANPEDRQRFRDAVRDVMTPPERLTIAQTGSMIIVTTGEGRVVRLSPDGKKVKDESTNIERKTKWDAGKLISEISGLGPRKITETYSAAPEHKQLHITVQVEGGQRPITLNRVYDAGSSD
jgi:hypothetical protein